MDNIPGRGSMSSRVSDAETLRVSSIPEVLIDDSSSTSFGDKDKWTTTMSPSSTGGNSDDYNDAKQNFPQKSTESTPNIEGDDSKQGCSWSSGFTSASSGKAKTGTFEDLKFMQNFDPQRSSRNQQKKKKRYHHNDGRLVQYADDFEDCDCLRPNCVGCHFPCPSCSDTRCGHECRVSRKWIYEAIEIEGSNIEFRNPHHSTFT